MKPLNHRLWKLVYLLAIWTGLELGASVHCQSLDCSHDNTTIEYYDNMRSLPGYVTNIEGTEVTIKIADKHTVVTRTFHLTDQTQFYSEHEMKATLVDRTYFEKHKDGCWVVRYCAHCRAAYRLIKVEV